MANYGLDMLYCQPYQENAIAILDSFSSFCFTDLNTQYCFVDSISYTKFFQARTGNERLLSVFGCLFNQHLTEHRSINSIINFEILEPANFRFFATAKWDLNIGLSWF